LIVILATNPSFLGQNATIGIKAISGQIHTKKH
jgi:hypothetical protein